MKKSIFLIMLFSLIVSPALADINFTATEDIIINDVDGDGVTDIAMFIRSGSTAESWTFDDGTFTVTVTTPTPGSFIVGSSNSSVKSIKFMQGTTNLTCVANSDPPGTSYATAPTAAGTYTITPSTTTDCTSLCTAVDNAATLNSFPTCGALTCDSGYNISGSGSSATCVSSGSVAIFTTPPPPTTFQTYDPITGELIIGNPSEEEIANEEPAETETETTTPLPEESNNNGPNEPALTQIAADAAIMASGDVNEIIKSINVGRDLAAEINYNETVTAKIVSGSDISPETRNNITSFIAYGTQTTQTLGAGERGGVINSFKAAFGKLPETSTEWNDAIKIANGRWPSKTSWQADNRALINFRIVYLRDPDKSNPNDDAAITIMAYGLRPADRNLDSEKTAIKIFKDIYGYSPEKATAWDVVRAIAYSGATR